jgi:hypothetical protein
MSVVQRAEEFAERLAGVYGDDLVSAVLYGSAARGDYREGVSDLNLLVILRLADVGALRRGAPLAREWAGEGNPPPLLLGEAEWRGSADVFPIEYRDIRDAHVVLRGADPFAGLEIRWSDLRHQCEHELKGKQIQLREQFLLVSEEPERLGALLVHSFPSFLTLFRTLLRLAGDEVPRDSEAVVRGVAGRVGFDPEGLLRIQAARGRPAGFAPAADGVEVVGYLTAIKRSAGWLDAREPGPGAEG